MTNPTQAGAAPPEAPPVYTYVGGTPELDQLLAMEDDLYTKSKAIAEQLDEVKERIKVALTSVQLAPGRSYQRYRIALPGAAVRLLSWTVSRRLNTPALRADHPDIYEEYVREGGAWKLERER